MHILLPLGSFALDHIGDASGDIDAVYTDEVASTLCGSKLLEIDNVVSNDVLLDNTSLSCGDLIRVLA